MHNEQTFISQLTSCAAHILWGNMDDTTGKKEHSESLKSGQEVWFLPEGRLVAGSTGALTTSGSSSFARTAEGGAVDDEDQRTLAA